MKQEVNPELIDDENPEWTTKMFSEAKSAAELFPHLISQPVNKIKTTVEYDADIIYAFRAIGNDWQIRMNDALREWLQGHSVPSTHKI